jgi:hypothetical protein
MGVRVFSVVGMFDVISQYKQCEVCSFHGVGADLMNKYQRR